MNESMNEWINKRESICEKAKEVGLNVMIEAFVGIKPVLQLLTLQSHGT